MRARSTVTVAAVVLAVFFVVDLRVRPGGVRVTRGVDDIAQLTAALFATVVSLWRAARCRDHARASWLLIGAGTACWAAGEVVWSYYELIVDEAVPFPSLADVGYLLFPLFAAAGLLIRPSHAFTGRGRWRVTLDALLIAVSLFTLTWATALGEVYRGGTGTMLADVVGLAYPGFDLALLTVVFIVITYARTGNRTALALLAAGLTALAVGDSGFAYLTATGRYHTGNLIDAGWVTGFLLVGLAAVYDRARYEPANQQRLPRRSALLLPVFPSAIGLIAALWSLRLAPEDTLIVAAGTALACLLAARQTVVLLDNRSLMALIAYRAHHDALTDLANRALFMDRLRHALDLRQRDRRPVALFLIDLDGFKAVNDSYGHSAGDQLLIQVGHRLGTNARKSDTVARLGGDEFAVLIEDGGDAVQAARRLLASIQLPVTIGEHIVSIGASVGVTTLSPAEAALTPTDMLHRADLAMYAAKHDGKATVCAYTPDMIRPDQTHPAALSAPGEPPTGEDDETRTSPPTVPAVRDAVR